MRLGERGRGAAIGLVMAVLIPHGPAVGAAAPAKPAAPVQAVLNCIGIKPDSARLACFDAAAPAMGQAEVKGDLLTLDQAQRREVRRQSFGLALPSFTLFDRGEKPEEADRLSAKVASAGRGPRGEWIVKLEDGATWRQVDQDELLHAPRAGSEVILRRGILGSFFMNIDKQSAIRVHRDS